MEPMLKSQTVRLIDISIYGPYLIWVASKGNITKLDKVLLMALGVGTIIYNFNNYEKYKRLN